MRARIQTIPTEGGRIASRGRFVPVFILGNKWQLMIFFMGRSGPPAPSVSAHIRVSNSLNSHFIYFFFLLGLVNSSLGSSLIIFSSVLFFHSFLKNDNINQNQ